VTQPKLELLDPNTPFESHFHSDLDPKKLHMADPSFRAAVREFCSAVKVNPGLRSTTARASKG